MSGTGRFAIIGNAAALRAPRDQRNLAAIGESLKADYIVIGQVQREGERVRVLAHLIRLPEQKHLWVTRVEAVPSELTPPAGLAQRISTEFLWQTLIPSSFPDRSKRKLAGRRPPPRV